MHEVMLRKDWEQIKSVFEAEGYRFSNGDYRKAYYSSEGNLLGFSWFDCVSNKCCIYNYEPPKSETNDLARPRLYNYVRAERWDRLSVNDIIKLIQQSATAVAKFEAWVDNYDLM